MSPAALDAIVSLVINSLMISYMLVVGCSLYARRTRHAMYGENPDHRPFIGPKLGTALDAISLPFLAVAFIIALSVSNAGNL